MIRARLLGRCDHQYTALDTRMDPRRYPCMVDYLQK
ncbi:hypothetical protein RSAG8_09277, partial [Rhizoctonia solani AG-8 WAC10335]